MTYLEHSLNKEVCIIPHKRSDYGKSRQRELKRLWREAFHDNQIRESVALNTYPLLDIRKGEVLRNSTGYTNPSLDPHREKREQLLKTY